MAGIGSLFGGIAQGLQAGMGLAQRQQALQQHQQTIDLEKQKQDIALQQLQGAMADSKALTAAMSVGIPEQKAQADALGLTATLGNLAAMKPNERSTLVPTTFAAIEQKMGKPLPQVVKDFFAKTPPETLQPLVDSMAKDIAANGPGMSMALLGDPMKFTTVASALARRNADTADQAALAPPEQSALDVNIKQQQFSIGVLQKRLNALLELPSKHTFTNPDQAKQYRDAVEKLNDDITQRQGQLNTLVEKRGEVKGYAPGSALYQNGQQIGSVPERSRLLGPDEEAQQVRIAGAKASATAQARQDVADTATPDLSPEALSRAAAQYNIDGSLPALGRGAKGVKARLDIIEEATQQAADAGDTAAEAAARATMNKAVLSGYRQLEAQGQKVSAFEKTAKMNADKALEFAGKVDNTGVPIFNRWINAGKTAGTDDPDLAAFNTYVNGFRNEYARIVTTATGGGVTTDTARAEFDKIINTAQAPEAFKAAVNAAKQEMDNRLQGFEDSRQEVRAKFLNLKKGGSGKPAEAAAATPRAIARPKSKAEYDALKDGDPYLAPDGSRRIKGQ